MQRECTFIALPFAFTIIKDIDTANSSSSKFSQINTIKTSAQHSQEFHPTHCKELFITLQTSASNWHKNIVKKVDTPASANSKIIASEFVSWLQLITNFQFNSIRSRYKWRHSQNRSNFYYCPLKVLIREIRKGWFHNCGVSPNCYLCFCDKTSITWAKVHISSDSRYMDS